MKKQYLEVGKIVNTHGVKGEMKLALWCSGIDFLKQFKVLYLDMEGQQPVSLVSVRGQGAVALIQLSNVKSFDEAVLLKNTVLFMDRADAVMQENEHFVQDLIGCKVIELATEKTYGTVIDVTNTGASDLYVVQMEDKREFLIPVIPDIVKEVDVKSAVIRIKAMKGLFLDED